MYSDSSTNIEIEKPGKLAISIWQYAFLACCILSILLILVFPQGVTNFADRAIGITIVKNINIDHRMYTYILALVAGISFLTYTFLRFWSKNENERVSEIRAEPLAWLLGICALLNFVTYIGGGDKTLYLTASIFVIVLLGFWYCSSYFSTGVFQKDVFFRNVCVSWQGACILFLMSAWHSGGYFWLAWIVCFSFLISIQKMLAQITSFSGVMFWENVFWSFSLWIVASPLLYIAANEIGYFMTRSGYESITPIFVFALLSIIICAASSYGRSALSDHSKLLALCVLVSTVVINQYDTSIVYSSYDLFHLGEKILPLQQWSSFRLLPFVDYMPTHGLADAVPQFLYQWLSGGSAFESLIWGNGHFQGWFMHAIAISSLYWLVAKLTHPVTAFFLLWLLPTYHIVEPYFTFLLLPAIHILNMQKYRSLNNWWLIQWLLTVFLFVWRLDFGIAAIVGNITIAILSAWYNRNMHAFSRSLFIGAALLFTALTAFFLLSPSHGFINTLIFIKMYISNMALVTSYDRIYEKIDFAVIVQYFLFPLITAAVLAHTTSLLVSRRSLSQKLPIDLLIVFFSVTTLTLSLRSLQRHSILEGDFNNYFYLFIMLVFLIRHLPSTRIRTPSLIIAIFIMSCFWIMPTAENSFLRSLYHPSVTSEYPLVANGQNFPHWDVKPTRLVDNVDRYNDFIDFMGQSLGKGQSFYDFSNAPLIYALADVELPVYFPQTLLHTSDTIQKKILVKLESWHSQHRLPFVIFRQNTFFDNIDGVDNALRSYLIVEFIYRKYIPCVRVNQFDLWVDMRLASALECKNRLLGVFPLSEHLRDRLVPLRMHYLKQYVEFHNLPYIWANMDSNAEAIYETRALHVERKYSTSWLLSNDTAGLTCGGRSCYMDLFISSDVEQKAVISYSSENQLDLTLLPGKHRYRIRMSLLWSWFHADDLSRLELTGELPLSVLEGNIVMLATTSPRN